MAKSKTTISSISIEKLEKGCVVRVETKTEDKNGYDGFTRQSKSYTAEDDLMDEVMKYCSGEDSESEEDMEDKSESVRKVNPKTFLKSSK